MSLVATINFVPSAKAVSQTFGYTTEATTSQTNIEDIITGSKFTCSSNASITNIKAYIEVYNYWNTTAKAAIYFTNNTLLANSSEIDLLYSGGDPEWFTFPFSGTNNVTAGTEYILVVWAEATSGAYYLQADAGDTDQGYVDSETYTTDFPDPLVPTNNNNEYSIYCTVSTYEDYNYFFYGLYDENTGVLKDAADREVTVTAYFNDGTAAYSFDVNGSSYQSFSSSPEYFFFELGTVDRQYWLSEAEGNADTINIYIFNSTLTEYTLSFFDWSGVLSTYSYVSASRYINGTEVVVDKRKVDAQSKVIMGLETGKTYVVSVEATAGTTYTWGELTVAADTTLNLIVRGIDFPQDIILTYQYVRAWANRTVYDTTNDTITVNYLDTREATNTVYIYIYDTDETLQNSYTYSDTDTFSYSWNGAVWNQTYLLQVVIDHEEFSILTFKQTLSMSLNNSVLDIGFLGNMTGVTMNDLIPNGILVAVATIFSATTAGLGGIVIVAVAAMLNFIGFHVFDSNLLVLVGALAILYAIMKNYRRKDT